jgi:hypothetical protein
MTMNINLITSIPVPVWTEFGEELEEQQSGNKQLLFSVSVRLKNITIMATTPANSGVRFETGVSELHFSNRVENIQVYNINFSFSLSLTKRPNKLVSVFWRAFSSWSLVRPGAKVLHSGKLLPYSQVLDKAGMLVMDKHLSTWTWADHQ